MTNFIKKEENKILDTLHSLNYDIKEVKLLPSNNNFGDYQFNGIMSIAKLYSKNPIDIANELISKIDKSNYEKIEVAGPGFINITFKNESLINYFNEYILEKYPKNNKKIIIDYGGPNVAKALHVGHLRSANIGEALKRLAIFLGDDVISDIHLGDFGRPLGLIILELKKLHPDWVYFDENYNGEYPKENIITNEELENLYPIASNKAKEDPSYLEEARIITTKLQKKEKGYYDLWKLIVEVSVNNIKKLYDVLNISFDLWNGESDADEFTEDVINYLKAGNYTRMSEGALVVDIEKEDDKLPMPPVLLIKSNDSISYETTDIATIWDRVHTYNPDEIWYVVDNRQSLHFESVFRVCYKSNIVNKETKLEFLGFGTMNGTDGKPFKTRDGGVMTLENLINMVKEEVSKKITDDNKEDLSNILAVAALKYADLLPVRQTDYIFDINKFCDLNGKTGIYLLYSLVRMNSIIKKAEDIKFDKITIINNDYDRNLYIKLLEVDAILNKAYDDKSLSYITDYLYNLAKLFNSFYDNCNILKEEKDDIKTSWLFLTKLVYNVMSVLTNILGIEIPDKM